MGLEGGWRAAGGPLSNQATPQCHPKGLGWGWKGDGGLLGVPSPTKPPHSVTLRGWDGAGRGMEGCWGSPLQPSHPEASPRGAGMGLEGGQRAAGGPIPKQATPQRHPKGLGWGWKGAGGLLGVPSPTKPPRSVT